jgi:hypothetical protein
VCRPTRDETFPAGRTTIFTGLKSATRMDPSIHNNEAFFTQTSFLGTVNVVQAPMYYIFQQRCVIRSDHPVYTQQSFPFHAPTPLVTSRPGRLLRQLIVGSTPAVSKHIHQPRPNVSKRVVHYCLWRDTDALFFCSKIPWHQC